MKPTNEHKYSSPNSKIKKQKPNWSISALYSDRQLIRGKKFTKFFIPYDSVIPDNSFFAYVFRSGENEPEQIHLDQETYLIGRENFCDICFQSPDISRQHCAIQFRRVRIEGSTDPTPKIIPYIFDICSYNGTYINGEKISSSRFVQLFPNDSISFGKSNDSIVIMQKEQETKTNFNEE